MELYLWLSCFCVITLLLILLRLTRPGISRLSRLSLKVKSVLAILIVVLPALPYAKVEILTWMFGSYLKQNLYQAMKYNYDKPGQSVISSKMGSKLVYFKVFSMSPSRAHLYFVTFKKPTKEQYEHSMHIRRFHLPEDDNWGFTGFIANMKKTRKGWRLAFDEGYYYWSDMDNGHETPFPPYPAEDDFDWTPTKSDFISDSVHKR